MSDDGPEIPKGSVSGSNYSKRVERIQIKVIGIIIIIIIFIKHNIISVKCVVNSQTVLNPKLNCKKQSIG